MSACDKVGDVDIWMWPRGTGRDSAEIVGLTEALEALRTTYVEELIPIKLAELGRGLCVYTIPGDLKKIPSRRNK